MPASGGSAPPETTEARGRAAPRPGEIPASGWRDVALRVKAKLGDDHLTLVAAGVAFYGLLAVVPALAALVSLYGLVANPSGIAQTLQSMPALPATARDVVLEQLRRIAGASPSALGAGLVVSLGLALWSANKGTKALVAAIHIVHDEEDRRGFVGQTALALAFTTGVVVAAAVGIAVIAVLPALLGRLGLGPAARLAGIGLPWIVLLGTVYGLLLLLYRHAAYREAPRWRWVRPGAVFATTAWAVASMLFSIYVANFSSYNETYGSMGGAVVMLLWLWISALVVLIGAELNSELERQTRRDSTVGVEAPMGARGARSADTLGPTP